MNFQRTKLAAILAAAALFAAPAAAHARAVAKVIEKPEELIGGIKTEGRLGDFLLANDKVAFVIERNRRSSNQGMYGGQIADAGLALPGGGYGKSLFDDIAPIFNGGKVGMFEARTFKPDVVEVAADGSNGEPAVVRATGQDASMHFVDQMLGFSVPTARLDVVVEYELKPGETFLTKTTTLTNRSSKKRLYGIGFVYFLGDGLELFTRGNGFDRKSLNDAPADLFGMLSENISYGIYDHDAPETLMISEGGIFVGAGKEIELESGESQTFARIISVGSGDFASIAEPILRMEGETVQVSGRAQFPANAPDRANVYIFKPGAAQPVSLVRTDAEGNFTLALPPGDYEAQAAAAYYPSGERVSFKAGDGKPVGLSLPETGFIEFAVDNGEGNFIPATLAFDARGEIASDPILAPVNRFGGGYELIHWTITGKGRLPVLPGKYLVSASRGLEYEIDEKELEFKAGEILAANFQIAHSVDARGYIGGDFHVHSLGSNDTDDTYEEKVMASLGVGLEVPISTEHDHLGDYTPAIQKLGVEGQVVPVTGEELTTIKWGHFNAFPLERDTSKPNNGAIYWVPLTIPEVFEAFRNDPGEEVVQVNHPRSQPGQTGAGGYFVQVGYDPITGAAQNQKQWSDNFDAIETLNGRSYGEMEDLLLDLYSFLNMGQRKSAAGNSDSHGAYSLNLGYPRNLVRVSDDDPARLNMEEFVENIRMQRLTMDGGHFVLPALNGEPETMGEMFYADDGRYELSVYIQAPSWADLTKIEIVENGEKIKTLDVAAFMKALDEGSAPAEADGFQILNSVRSPKTGNFTRFAVKTMLEPARDAWYMVRTYGEADLRPVYPGARPRSFTNPFWIDVDGDGEYSPVLKR